MPKRMLYLLFALLILVVSTGLTRAEPQKPRSKPVKVFMGTFVNPQGGVHQIQVVDGGHINIKNSKEGLFYRLSARTGKNGMIDVTLEQYLDADYSSVIAEERMTVRPDGRTKRSSLAPFQFTLDGARRARAEYRPGAAPNKAIGGVCCIDCGEGWEVCCGVIIFEPGWLACCWIDTSCAWCEVCAWWTE